MGDFNGRASVDNYCFNHPELITKKPLVIPLTASKKLIRRLLLLLPNDLKFRYN